MLFLYLHFPRLQLDTLFQAQSSKNEQQSSVTIIVDRRQNKIVQLNQNAQQEGIKLGMGLATALALHPNIRLIEYQSELEQQRIEELAEAIYQIVADIYIFPPQGLCLQLHSMLSLHKGLEPLWLKIKQVLNEAQVHFQYATGSSPLLAKFLAQAGKNQLQLKQQQQLSALGALSVSSLELSNQTTDSLNRVGVKTCEQLLRLPLKELAKRFNLELVTTLGKLKGELHHKLQAFQPPEQFQSEIELMYEITRSETLAHPIKHLLKKLEQFLLRRNLVSQQLHFALQQRDHVPITFSLASAQGEYKHSHWLKLLNLRLESIKLASPVIAITLTCQNLQTQLGAIADIFTAKKSAMEVPELISLLQAKLGQDKLFQLQQLADHHPVLANRLQPLTLNNYQSLLSTTGTHSQHKLRPSYLLAQPQRLTEFVELLHGPERLASHWWDKHSITRDYFIARTGQGQLCWLFRQPDNRWYVQGYFG